MNNVACHLAIRVVPDLADYLPCQTLLPGGSLSHKNAVHPLIKLFSHGRYPAQMQGEILSSHRPYICLNRPGVVLLGFGDLVDIVASDFWYVIALFCAVNLVDFYCIKLGGCRRSVICFDRRCGLTGRVELRHIKSCKK
jgi:hypothetical protein